MEGTRPFPMARCVGVGLLAARRQYPPSLCGCGMAESQRRTGDSGSITSQTPIPCSTKQTRHSPTKKSAIAPRMAVVGRRSGSGSGKQVRTL